MPVQMQDLAAWSDETFARAEVAGRHGRTMGMTIGSHRGKVTVAGKDTVELLEGLRSSAGGPDFTLLALPQSSPGLCPIPVPGTRLGPRGKHILLSETGRSWTITHSGDVVGLDTRRNLVVHLMTGQSAAERILPLRESLVLLAKHLGCLLVHGAGIGWEDLGILIVGPSGSGKSTLAAAALAHGWTVIGDDYVALHADGDRVHVQQVFRTLAPPPADVAAQRTPGHPRLRVPEQHAAALPISAIAMFSTVPGPRPVRASAAAIWRTLALPWLVTQSGTPGTSLDVFRTVSTAAPAWSVNGHQPPTVLLPQLARVLEEAKCRSN